MQEIRLLHEWHECRAPQSKDMGLRLHLFGELVHIFVIILSTFALYACYSRLRHTASVSVVVAACVLCIAHASIRCCPCMWRLHCLGYGVVKRVMKGL